MEPYQMEDPGPMVTSPITEALGATKVEVVMPGIFSPRFMTVRCLFTAHMQASPYGAGIRKRRWVGVWGRFWGFAERGVRSRDISVVWHVQDHKG